MPVASITSRDQFAEYCLRRLGKPVIEINVDPEQVNDRIDDALKYYWDFHYDGTDQVFYTYILTHQDIINGYITLPDDINGAIDMFPIGDYIATNNIFNIRYQIALNDLYTLTYQSMVPYYMAFQQLQLLEQLLVGQQPFRYNRIDQKFYIDTDWSKLNPGYFLAIRVYKNVDPDVYTKVWQDRWLQQYATAKIKQQWGANLIKFSGMQLPGGVQFNGEKIYNDATEEIAKLEDRMMMDYNIMPTYMMG